MAGGGAMNPAAAAAADALSVAFAYAAAVAAAGGDGDEFCIEEPVEVSRLLGPHEGGDGPAPPPPQPPRPLGSSRGVLRRFFHLARRFWNHT